VQPETLSELSNAEARTCLTDELSLGSSGLPRCRCIYHSLRLITARIAKKNPSALRTLPHLYSEEKFVKLCSMKNSLRVEFQLNRVSCRVNKLAISSEQLITAW